MPRSNRRKLIAQAVKRRPSPFGKGGRPPGIKGGHAFRPPKGGRTLPPSISGGKTPGEPGPSPFPEAKLGYFVGARGHRSPASPRKLGKVTIPGRLKNRG